MSASTRIGWISADEPLSIVQQCELAQVPRSTFYDLCRPASIDLTDLAFMALIDEEYTKHPFYGSRRMTAVLRTKGHTINRKRVVRLMRQMGLAGIAPGPNTSKPHPEHRIYPYLLRGVAVIRPNQVWSTDITFIRLARGFMYLVAVMDWYSRRVLSWRISNTMDSTFCVDCLQDALNQFSAPEIFNSDQGAQFTSKAFTGLLESKNISISMDGRGRALDNVFVERLWRSLKYEDIYIRDYGTVQELMLGLTEYFRFYNHERPHQALNDRTPDEVYQTGSGGGAKIVDRFSSNSDTSKVVTGQRRAAEIEEMETT